MLVVATPLPFTPWAAPEGDPSMLNCTVPVGVPPPGFVTVAVNTVLCPYTVGFTDDVNAVVDCADLTT